MTKEEIFEEIRALLREAQADSVEDPWNYEDAALIIQVRSALRHLRVSGLAIESTMSEEGQFDEDPTEIVGVLIALLVATRLLSGDLVQKLLDGELGVYFRTGSDIIDTKTSSMSFEKKAANFRGEFEVVLAKALTDMQTGAANHFGGQVPYEA